MANEEPANSKAVKRGPGRPSTGKAKGKLSVTVNHPLIKAASKAAAKNGESLSQWVSRAISNQLIGA